MPPGRQRTAREHGRRMRKGRHLTTMGSMIQYSCSSQSSAVSSLGKFLRKIAIVLTGRRGRLAPLATDHVIKERVASKKVWD